MLLYATQIGELFPEGVHAGLFRDAQGALRRAQLELSSTPRRLRARRLGQPAGG